MYIAWKCVKMFCLVYFQTVEECEAIPEAIKFYTETLVSRLYIYHWCFPGIYWKHLVFVLV